MNLIEAQKRADEMNGGAGKHCDAWEYFPHKISNGGEDVYNVSRRRKKEEIFLSVTKDGVVNKLTE